MDARGVACAAVLQHETRHVDRLVHARHHHTAQNGRELFLQQHMASLRVGDGANQCLAVAWHLHTSGLRNLKRGAAHHLAIELAAGEGMVLDLLYFFFGAHMRTLAGQGLLHLRRDARVQHEHRRRRAGAAVVKVLGGDDGLRSGFEVGAGVHINRHIARAHANGGVARAIGRTHHGRATGGQNHVGAGVAHQRARGLDRGTGQDLQSIGRAAGFFNGRLQFMGHGGAAPQSHRVRRDDQRVARHQAQDGLEDDGGHRRGGVGQAHHHTGRAANLDDAQRIVAAHAAQGHVVPGVGRERAGDLVLGDLVGHFANAAFAHGPLGIKLGTRQQGGGHFLGHALGFLGRPLRQRGSGLPGAAQQVAGLLQGGQVVVGQVDGVA